jgi:hypothetical protein
MRRTVGVTDFVATMMFGLSTKARAGQGVDRPLATAQMAGFALEKFLRAA